MLQTTPSFNSLAAKPAPIFSGEGKKMVQFFDPQVGRQAVKLLPADYFVGDGAVAIVTVLGSCVAACMRDPVLKVGGMNHFMLPDDVSGDGSDARYGSYLMEVMINELLKLGASRNRIEAKVFGGGNVLRGFTNNPVGTRNAQFVLDYLSAERIPVIAKDLVGIHPRKVCFFPDTGTALVRKLPHAHDAEVAAEESTMRHQLLASIPKKTGDVELFS